MKPQSYESHTYQPVATGVGYFFVIVALVGFAFRWYQIGGRAPFAIALLAVVGALITLLFISRAYTTRLQDRIIKLEMRMRCGPLLTPDQHRMMAALSNKQIAALRFASDGEIPALLETAVREQLKPKDIKRAVKAWVPDHDRT